MSQPQAQSLPTPASGPAAGARGFIDPRGPRFGAAVTSLVLIVVLATGWGWLLVAQAAVFALSAVSGLRLSPYGYLYRTLVRPRLAPPVELENPAPPVFAQFVGLGFAIVGSAGYLAGWNVIALAATGLALAAAFLNAAFDYCLGCEVYLLVHRAAPRRTPAGYRPSGRIRPLPTLGRIAMPAFPPIEPYDSGLLDVGDGQLIHWEQCGDPHGIPVLRVHGGPGSGCTAAQRSALDPGVFRTILFDQRNCGRSLPSAANHEVDLGSNTTRNLVADMERLREHLGVEKWILYGGSWGSALLLAYAEEHPERVMAAVIAAVCTTRRSEIAWLYEGVGRFFPREWERFRDHVPADERGEDVFDLLAAYGRLAADPDPAVRAGAVASWVDWEDTVISLEPNGTRNAYGSRPDAGRRALVRICAHYFSQGAFLEDGQLLREAGRLAAIPAVLIHGRFDLGGPLQAAWDLARAWPGAELVVAEDSGHTGSAKMSEAVQAAFARFAKL